MVNIADTIDMIARQAGTHVGSAIISTPVWAASPGLECRIPTHAMGRPLPWRHARPLLDFEHDCETDSCVQVIAWTPEQVVTIVELAGLALPVMLPRRILLTSGEIREALDRIPT